MSGIISDNQGKSSGVVKAAGGGIVLQKQHMFYTMTKSTSTAVWPWDNTIPQNNEGIETMTLAITPSNASNKLLIEAQQFMTNNTATELASICLFQDSTANAIACSMREQGSANYQQQPIKFVHYMDAGTTSTTTFRIRVGNGAFTHNHNGGTMTFNGVNDSVSTML